MFSSIELTNFFLTTLILLGQVQNQNLAFICMWRHYCQSTRGSYLPLLIFWYKGISALYLFYDPHSKVVEKIVCVCLLYIQQNVWTNKKADSIKSRAWSSNALLWKNQKGKVTSPRTLTIMRSHAYKCHILVLNSAKKSESSEEKLFTSILLNKIVSKHID